jgi:hypothetical protein
MGTLFGAPALGAVIDQFSFEAMFLSASAVLVAVAVSFAAASLADRRRTAAQLEAPPEAEDIGAW